jgi:hypothetical protein
MAAVVVSLGGVSMVSAVWRYVVYRKVCPAGIGMQVASR